MKNIAITLLFLGTFSATGQTIYQVPANSQHNQIALTLANESTRGSVNGITVKPLRHSSAVTITSPNVKVKTIAATKESEVAFTFDVGREARVNAKDTLLFLVTDASGLAWTKSIIVTFTPPATFALDQNFPNPFNPSTTIYYQLPAPGRVVIKVYDILGREVRTLVDEEREAGYHTIRFDASGIASGAYFYRMMANGKSGGTFTQLRKLMVLK